MFAFFIGLALTPRIFLLTIMEGATTTTTNNNNNNNNNDNNNNKIEE